MHRIALFTFRVNKSPKGDHEDPINEINKIVIGEIHHGFQKLGKDAAVAAGSTLLCVKQLFAGDCTAI